MKRKYSKVYTLLFPQSAKVSAVPHLFISFNTSVMYVPGGFPHTTDTTTVVEEETVLATDDETKEKIFDESSVHLTTGLHIHVWALTYAHIRWTLPQRCGREWKLDIKNDKNDWNSMRSLPVGFLSAAGMDPNFDGLA